MAVNCYCGLPARYRTSWTDNNHGRPYRICPNNQENGGCNFFEFVGSPCCSRCKQIIPGLLRRLDVQRSEMEVQRNEIQRLENVVETERLSLLDFCRKLRMRHLLTNSSLTKKLRHLKRRVPEELTGGEVED